MEDWCIHPLMRFDNVSRWMHEPKCKDSSKVQHLSSLGIFLRAIVMDNPDKLIDEYIRDMRSDDPCVRLRTVDRMDRFYQS